MSINNYRSKVFAGLRTDSPIMFVDPGIMGTGYAQVCEDINAIESGVIDPRKTWTWDQNARLIVARFIAIVNGKKPSRIVFEFPEFWETPKGHASAAKGDLFKLAFLIGGLSQIAWKMSACPVYVSPREWKGQLPKSLVITRVTQIIGRVPVNHEADAIGMAIAAIMGRI